MFEEPFLVCVFGGGEDLSEVRTKRDVRLLGLEEAVCLCFFKDVKITDWRTLMRRGGKKVKVYCRSLAFDRFIAPNGTGVDMWVELDITQTIDWSMALIICRNAKKFSQICSEQNPTVVLDNYQHYFLTNQTGIASKLHYWQCITLYIYIILAYSNVKMQSSWAKWVQVGRQRRLAELILATVSVLLTELK